MHVHVCMVRVGSGEAYNLTPPDVQIRSKRCQVPRFHSHLLWPPISLFSPESHPLGTQKSCLFSDTVPASYLTFPLYLLIYSLICAFIHTLMDASRCIPFTLYIRPCVTVPALWISCSAVFTIPILFQPLWPFFPVSSGGFPLWSTLQVWVPHLRPVLRPAPSCSGPPVLTAEAAVQPSARWGRGARKGFTQSLSPAASASVLIAVTSVSFLRPSWDL